jgi:hypothetical protein
MHQWNRIRSLAVLAICLVANACANTDASATDKTSVPYHFDASGNATVDGKPCFPLAIFVDLPPKLVDDDSERLNRALDQVAVSPYRVLINHAAIDGTVDQFSRFQEALSKRGLVQFSAVGPSESSADNATKLAANSPSLAGWYISPEVARESGKAKSLASRLKQLDAAHPVLITIENKDPVDQDIVRSADIASIFAYPVPRRRLIDVPDAVDRLTENAQASQSKWFVLQAQGQYVYDKNVRSGAARPKLEEIVGVGRAPTPKEMRAMAHLALAHGATGLAVYYQKDIELTADAEQRWQSLVSLGNELNTIAPYLAGKAFPRETLHDDNYSIHLRMAELNGKRYLFAVNSVREYQNVFIDRLPWPIRKVTVVQGHGFAAGASDYGTNEIVIGLDALDAILIEIE